MGWSEQLQIGKFMKTGGGDRTWEGRGISRLSFLKEIVSFEMHKRLSILRCIDSITTKRGVFFVE